MFRVHRADNPGEGQDGRDPDHGRTEGIPLQPAEEEALRAEGMIFCSTVYILNRSMEDNQQTEKDDI